MKKTLQDFLPKVISRKSYYKTIIKLTDLQLACLKSGDAMNPETLIDITEGIKDIVGTFAGKEGLGLYSTETLSFVMRQKNK